MNANRPNSAGTSTGSTLEATPAATPQIEVETLATFEEFSRSIDDDLARLERDYAAFCTRDSVHVSLGR